MAEESSPVGELTRGSRIVLPDCVLDLCTQTLVNPLLDQRVSAARDEPTWCRQPACVLSLCTPTLVNPDERVRSTSLTGVSLGDWD